MGAQHSAGIGAQLPQGDQTHIRHGELVLHLTSSVPQFSPSVKWIMILFHLCEALLKLNHLQISPAAKPSGAQAGPHSNISGFSFKQPN